EVTMLRGGIWKPRTRPEAFEGRGEQGLVWLREAKRETGQPVATEVATPEHVELALKYEIEALWIGDRTVVNPFSVQQIADALNFPNDSFFCRYFRQEVQMTPMRYREEYATIR
ncbi:MAG: AraC family transcriptional regulator, partial [Treponema sp.]|nr:AraC family transcriptional regulator [Treponema sp.]